MARHKDLEWELPGLPVPNWDTVHAALAMDIRDELKKLNSLLHCQDFLEIPFKLHHIDLNTRKPVSNKPTKKKPTVKRRARGS